MIRDIYNEMKNSCSIEEQNRIEQELDLFAQRKWEKLAVASLDLLKALSGQFVSLGGSALDSYFLRKAFDPTSIDIHLLHNEKAKEILFHDALRLNIRCPLFLVDEADVLINVAACIDAVYKKHNLFVRQSIVDRYSEIVAFSEKQINDTVIKTIVNENKESTPKETEILYKVLIIKIEIKEGLSCRLWGPGIRKIMEN